MPEGRFSVELTQGAEDDLEQIYDYVSVHRSRDAALALLDAFAETMATLTQFPERGSVPDEFEVLGLREFRQILMAPYRIIYRPLASRVFIIVIADGRRDMQSHLERRLLRR
jgi:toxin ParE1/3/4